MLDILETKWCELSLEGKHQEADRIQAKIEELRKINYLEDLDAELIKKIQWLVVESRNISAKDSDAARRIFAYVKKYSELKDIV